MVPIDKKIHYTLRFASAMCFIGHGAFGIITKQVWCNYFSVFGIGHDMAYQLMPLLGAVDILLGISLLIYPIRAILLWLVLWGTITASLRPMSGEPFAEFIERAGNYGVPLAFLIWSGHSKSIKGWFVLVSPAAFAEARTLAGGINCLRLVVFLFLLGHGWLNLIGKNGLINQYSSLGFSNPIQTAYTVGVFEIMASIMVLIRPVRPILLVLLIWKMGSELFYPHWELFEWIERGGSYGAILSLWYMLPRTSIQVQSSLQSD